MCLSGLKGEEIPLTARISSVVDVWGAAITNRPYRKAFSHTRAIEMIRSEAGKYFDPQLEAVYRERSVRSKFRH